MVRYVIAVTLVAIVGGVSGSGKTTVGALLAGKLRWEFADADDFHPEANIAKMHAGIPLTDEDRRPWLLGIAAWMDEQAAAGRSAVVTCSALHQWHRDLLMGGRPWTRLIFLTLDRETLLRRLASRQGHFFPEQLLDSQLQTVQVPRPDERTLVIMPTGTPPETASEAVSWLTQAGAGPADRAN